MFHSRKCLQTKTKFILQNQLIKRIHSSSIRLIQNLLLRNYTCNLYLTSLEPYKHQRYCPIFSPVGERTSRTDAPS